MEKRSAEEAIEAAAFEAREAIEAEAAFITRVREHASAHYNEGGWDFVIECWEDREIAQALRDAGGDATKALADIAEAVGVVDERRADIRAEIF